MTVLVRIEAARHMNPHRSAAVVLEQQLVDITVLFDEAEVRATRLQVGQVYVSGLTAQVLRLPYPMHALVDSLRAEATIDADGTELPAQRFEHPSAQVLQCCQLQTVGGVVYMTLLCPHRAGHLMVAEMLSQLKIFSCHSFLLFYRFYVFTLFPFSLLYFFTFAWNSVGKGTARKKVLPKITPPCPMDN